MIETHLQFVPEIHREAFVHAMATVIGEVRIGARTAIWPGAVLRGDEGLIVIGDETSIQDGTVIHATRGLSTVTVGSQVTVGHQVCLHGCVVEDRCLIGIGAIVLDQAVIGRGSLIAAGALVTPRTIIPPGSFVLGSPARVLRPCGPKEEAMIVEGYEAYLARLAEYRAS